MMALILEGFSVLQSHLPQRRPDFGGRRMASGERIGVLDLQFRNQVSKSGSFLTESTVMIQRYIIRITGHRYWY